MMQSSGRDEIGRIRFQARVLEAVGQAVIATDVRGKIVYWNTAAEAMYGWSSDEVMGLQIGDVLVSGEPGERAEEIMAELGRGNSWSGEFNMVTRGGEMLSLLVSDRPVYGEDGEMIGLVGVSTDITDRKRMEESLKESEERFRELHDATFEGIFIHDGERILEANEALATMSGYEKREMIGSPGPSFVTPESREIVARHIREGSGEPYEVIGITKGGARRNLEVRGREFGYRGRPARLVSVRDVTDRKRMEENLRSTRELLMGLLDNAPLPIYTVSGEGRIGLVNHFFADFVGMSVEEANGAMLEDAFTDEEARQFREINDRVIETGTPLVEEEWAETPDGPHYFQTIKFPLRGPGEGVEGVGGISLDITDRKRMEESLKESREHYRMIARATNDAIWEVDLATEELRWVGEARQIFGYSADEIKAGEWWEERVHPDDRERVVSGIGAMIRNGGTWTDEYRFLFGDGTYGTVLDRAFLVRGEDGGPGRLIGSMLDVTRRREAEEALEASERRLNLIYQNTTDVLFLLSVEDDGSDHSYRFISVNDAFLSVTGLTREQVVDRPIEEVLPSSAHDLVRGKYGEALRENKTVGWEEISEYPSGTRYGEVRVTPMRDGPKGRRYLVGSVNDITRLRVEQEARRMEYERHTEALGESEEQLRALTDATLEALVISERPNAGRGSILGVNKAFTEIFGYEPEEFAGEDARSIIAPESWRVVEDNIASGHEGVYEAIGIRKDGTRLRLEIRGKTTTYRGRRVRISALRDVTERKRAEEERDRMVSFVETSGDAIITGSLEGTITTWNRGAEGLYGFSAGEMTGRSIYDLELPERRGAFAQAMEKIRQGESIVGLETVQVTKDGRRVHVSMSASPTRDHGGNVVGIAAVNRDISERKVLEEQLVHQAFHDALTGLPNRALFADRLEHALAGTRRSGSGVAVLFTDLDNFKAINDSLGHETGDELLVAVAGRLRACLRPEDTLARFGGDEFVILIEDVKIPSDVARVANRVADEFMEPFELGGREVFVSASIGISLEDSEDAMPEIVLRNADTAMYQAKGRSGASYEVFEPGMYARVLRRLEMGNDLRRAVDGEQFRVHYQPQVGLESGKIVGMEALLRWEHPERGLIGPSEFIPLAEETGLIVPLGGWVLREACRQTRTWHEDLPEASGLEISVNLSLGQLTDAGLVDTVADALRDSGLEPGCLQLEITESVAMKDAEFTVRVLQDLKKLGVKLAIDDFGKGHSSLTYLIKRFQMDILKIDRSFTAELSRDSDYQAIVSGITGIARSLNLRVVVEGIENAGQRARARSMGCTTGQGFFFSRPVPSEEASSLLAAGTRL